MASRPSRGGFTLLEVLVAIALLGLVVSVLARSAIQGLGYEGDAARRLHASLLADAQLWRVEAELKLGAPPKPLHEESTVDEEFRVSLDVQPLDLSQTGLAALMAPAQGAAPAPAAAANDPAAVPLPIFQILVRVGWVEGLRELEVTRSTFAYDGSAAAQALGGPEKEGSAPPPAEEQPQ